MINGFAFDSGKPAADKRTSISAAMVQGGELVGDKAREQAPDIVAESIDVVATFLH